MQNRVTVTISGQSYTLLALEDEAYVQRVAAYVDKKMAETAGSGLAQYRKNDVIDDEGNLVRQENTSVVAAAIPDFSMDEEEDDSDELFFETGVLELEASPEDNQD